MNTMSNKGFTIIELVVVIAILGILAAVAMPKFASLESDARAAAFDGVRGGFVAAVQIAHSKWLVDGSGAADLTLQLDGDTVAVNSLGWPTLDSAQSDQDVAEELYAILMSGTVPTGWDQTETSATTVGTATYCLTGAGGGDFTYDAANGTVALTGTCP